MKSKIIIAATAMLLLLVAGAAAQENPVLRYSVSTQDPMPAEPGRIVEVWINVQNIGQSDARNIEIEFVDSFPFRLVSERDRIKEIPVLGTQKDYTLRYRVMVESDAPEGRNNLHFNYRIGNMPGVESTTRIPVQVQTSQAILSVSNVRLEPESLVPGGASDLTLSLKNLATGESLRDVTVALGLNPIIAGNTILADIPIVPSGSTNQKSVSRISPGQTSEFTFTLNAYPDAEAGIHKLPVHLMYTTDAGRFINQTTMVGVMINSEPDLEVLIDNTELNKDRLTGEVVFSIVNKGLSDLKLLTVRLGESDDFELLSPSESVYIGNIFSDDYQTVRYRVKASNPDMVTFPVTLEYKDALNNPQTETFNVEFMPRENQDGNGGTGLVLLILVVLVIIGIWYYKKKKKKHRED